MLAFALGVGIISYVIFILGVFGLFNQWALGFVGVGAITFCGVVLLKYRALNLTKTAIFELLRERSIFIKSSTLYIIVILFLNLISAIAPERAFDALWYHLVIPEVFVQEGGIFYIPGSLLYYSPMPKLIDLLYAVPLAFNFDLATRMISYIFGVLTIIVTYSLARQFVNKKLAFLAVVLLLSNLVFSWQMTTAYIDMARMFFETLGIFALFQWMKTKNNTLYVESALCMGLAIATKVISITTLFSVMTILVLYFIRTKKIQKIKPLILYGATALLVVLPWWLFAWVNTGNPFFPLFSNSYSLGFDINLLNPIHFLKSIWMIFTSSPDPVSPLYLVLIPLLFTLFKKMKSQEKILITYSAILLLAWYFTPNTGGGRFIMPYLSVFSVTFFIGFQYISSRSIQKFLFFMLILVSFITLIFRLYVAGRVIPVVAGFESRDKFLSKNLNFSFGDFYDTDGSLAKILTNQDVVLVYGVHNLHYANFNYIHESWVKRGDIFNYILTQNASPPDDFYFFRKIYANPVTNVTLYYGGGFWEY